MYHLNAKPRTTTAYSNAALAAFTTVDPSTHRLPFQTPKAIDDYNHYMGGVDIADQYESYYKTQRRESGNWIALFNRLFDISVINSFFLYKLAHDPDTGYEMTWKLPHSAHGPHLAFHGELASQLLQPNPERPKLKKLGTYITHCNTSPTIRS